MTIVRKAAFAPFADTQTRLLILGSLPGDASLAAREYYAHPRNAFWRLMERVIGSDLVILPYEDRLRALRFTGVGLWDVIGSGERKGSLDSAIQNADAADLKGLIADLPSLRAVAFNGGLAARIGRKTLGDVGGITMIDLPSSSAAHARPFDAKAAIWDQLAITLR